MWSQTTAVQNKGFLKQGDTVIKILHGAVLVALVITACWFVISKAPISPSDCEAQEGTRGKDPGISSQTTILNWEAANGVTLTRLANNVLGLSGTQAKDWNYVTVNVPNQTLKPGGKYRLEGWIRVESLSDFKFVPSLKFTALDKKGKYITDYVTHKYGLRNLNTWQKFWAEFDLDPRARQGFIAVDKGTGKPSSATLYVRDVVLIERPERPSQKKAEEDLLLDSRLSPFKHSDIIGFTQGSLKDYRDYGVTFVSWGGYPDTSKESILKYRRNIENALSVGTKIGAKIGIQTDFNLFIDFLPTGFMEARTIKIDGTPLIEPSSAPIRYKGYPAYWFCSNNTAFREYLKSNIKRVMELRPYGFMIDDPSGTAGTLRFGGCYCPYCIKGFRDYLKANFSKSELSENQIDDVDHFDLRQYHAPFADLPMENRPLYDQIVDFQLKESAELFRELKSYALAIRGQNMPVAGNINPTEPYFRYLSLQVDYYSTEIPMEAASGLLEKGQSLFTFKMADALKRPAVIMGYGGDHAFVQEKHLPGMVRSWVAEAYAFGNYFMAPYKLWASSGAKGSHLYVPRNENELAFLFQFIKRNPQLFDGYEVVARVGLVNSYRSFQAGRGRVGQLANQLADLNIPFEIVMAGDEFVDIPLSSENLKKYHTLIVPNSVILRPSDWKIIQEYRSGGGRVVENAEQIGKSTLIEVFGGEKVRATLRASQNDASRPAVLHLLNRDYDVATDSCRQKTNFTVRIPNEILASRKVRRVQYLSPAFPDPTGLQARQTDSLDLAFTVNGDKVEIIFPFLDFWGIAALTFE